MDLKRLRTFATWPSSARCRRRRCVCASASALFRGRSAISI